MKRGNTHFKENTHILIHSLVTVSYIYYFDKMLVLYHFNVSELPSNLVIFIFVLSEYCNVKIRGIDSILRSTDMCILWLCSLFSNSSNYKSLVYFPFSSYFSLFFNNFTVYCIHIFDVEPFLAFLSSPVVKWVYTSEWVDIWFIFLSTFTPHLQIPRPVELSAQESHILRFQSSLFHFPTNTHSLC